MADTTPALQAALDAVARLGRYHADTMAERVEIGAHARLLHRTVSQDHAEIFYRREMAALEARWEAEHGESLGLGYAQAAE